jgi:hypothetical protein
VYEITLRCAPPSSVTTRFPSLTLWSAPVATVLSRRVVDPLEIDELVGKLRSLGITPLEVHASHRRYEFRIAGRLGASILHSLRWAARLEQERTVIRISAAQGELSLILEELASNGIQIEHCIRCRGI